MSAQEILAALVDELPPIAWVEPCAFLDDELLPSSLTPVEPTAFALACVQALWGTHGPPTERLGAPGCHESKPRPVFAVMSGFVSRAFSRRREVSPELARRLPPGQYIQSGFPVLSYSPTPRIAAGEWTFRIEGMVGRELTWRTEEFRALPFEEIPCDIHCVTKWSKLGTSFGGVSVDALLQGAEPKGRYVMAFCHEGYTTNLPLADLTGGKAWIATHYEGEPLAAEHGGPARLLVPHLYFWKSAKWIAGLRIMDHEEPGFWESNGYQLRGDPWDEQRYWSD
jgi:DMSO/TMAO reductase YedYZ molybdopterin-dependent catalytic subunit